MKKIIIAISAIMIAFAILLPFASRAPDGVQDLIATSGNQQKPVWKGLMANYSVFLADPYLSALIAGLMGTAFVLTASFALSITIAPKKTKKETLH